MVQHNRLKIKHCSSKILVVCRFRTFLSVQLIIVKISTGEQIPGHGPSTFLPERLFTAGLTPYAFSLYSYLLVDVYSPVRLSIRRLSRWSGMSAGTVHNSIKELLRVGFLVRKDGLSPKNAVELLGSKPQHNLVGDLICAWCDSSTTTLQDHHYPVAKVDGGQATVAICLNCHSEFHALLRPKLLLAII